MVTPWYKQFWPWFLILLPLTVIIWSIVRIVILSHYSVSLVTEDYYKKGKGINIDLSKISVAEELAINASVVSIDKTIEITLNKGQLEHYPALQATFAHRTLPDRDFKQMITANASGQYRILLDEKLQGPWFIELTPHDQQWLVQGRVTFPSTTSIQLMK
ncbi:FixH family protein [Vibrio renipiscarius]|uniref:FixH family protein n=1 Tax=Vibrio renipiscarius TaxID=1461322 RepID=UPI00354C626E